MFLRKLASKQQFQECSKFVHEKIHSKKESGIRENAITIKKERERQGKGRRRTQKENSQKEYIYLLHMGHTLAI